MTCLQLATGVLLYTLLAAQAQAQSEFILQFSGNVPERFQGLVNVERVDDGKCARSCVLTSNVRTFKRNTRGNAVLSVRLPRRATRVCVHELATNMTFQKATQFFDRETTLRISPGDDFNDYQGQAWGGHGPKNAHVYVACSALGADAKSAYGLLIQVK